MDIVKMIKLASFSRKWVMDFVGSVAYDVLSTDHKNNDASV